MNISRLHGLWRGKDTDKGAWVFGDLIQIPKLDNHGKKVGVMFAIMERTPVAKCHYVDPSTLGECIGLRDKDRTPIFERDIIKHYNNERDKTLFDIGMVFWDVNKFRFLRTSQEGDYIYEIWRSSMKDYEIIGNAHDNPELLKGGK